MNNEILERAKAHVRQMMESGEPLREILGFLAREAEAHANDGSVCSVLILDQEGLLRNGASPGLPGHYLKAIDRLKPDPNLGTCAAAAATGLVVITPSFLEDDKWRELKHLPIELGFSAAWSQPMLDDEGRVLGTFGTYYRENRTPTQSERALVEALAQIASAVVATRSLQVTTIT